MKMRACYRWHHKILWRILPKAGNDIRAYFADAIGLGLLDLCGCWHNLLITIGISILLRIFVWLVLYLFGYYF